MNILDRLKARSAVSDTNGWTNPETGQWTGCHEWGGGLSDGYGRIDIDGRSVRTHRASYEYHHGPIPAGLVVCHHCDNRRCWNPDHLFAGTRAQNQTDMTEKGRSTKGETNPKAVLTEDQVLAIASDCRSQHQIAAAFGISRSAVRDIKTGRNWGWLTGRGTRAGWTTCPAETGDARKCESCGLCLAEHPQITFDLH